MLTFILLCHSFLKKLTNLFVKFFLPSCKRALKNECQFPLKAFITYSSHLLISALNFCQRKEWNKTPSTEFLALLMKRTLPHTINSIDFRHFWLQTTDQVQSLDCILYLNSTYRYDIKMTWECTCTCGQSFSFISFALFPVRHSLYCLPLLMESHCFWNADPGGMFNWENTNVCRC